MLPFHLTFRRAPGAAHDITDRNRNTDATGDQRLLGSPFESPIPLILQRIDPDNPLSKDEYMLLRAAYYATFTDAG